MTSALLGLLLLATDDLKAEVEPELPAPVWEIYVGYGGGLRVDEVSGGGDVMLGVNRKFFGFLRPELLVAASAFDGPFDLLIELRIGARLELPLDSRWKPYLWLAFAHNHESEMSLVAHDPLGHLFGVSEHGVHHRSGAEAGLGVAYELPRVTAWKIATRLGARATFTQFVGDSGPPRYVNLAVTAGVGL